MDKIVILTSRPEPDNSLVALLNMVFPDCEMQIVFMGAETFDACETDSFSGPFTIDMIGRAPWPRF